MKIQNSTTKKIYVLASVAGLVLTIGLFSPTIYGIIVSHANAQATIQHVLPLPALSDAQLQQLTTIAENYPGVQAWASQGWKYLGMDFLGTAQPSSWTDATIHLRLPSTAKAPEYCNEGWDAAVRINLNTMKVVDALYPSKSNDRCGGMGFAPPVNPTKSGSAGNIANFIVPQAFATITTPGEAVARQNDVGSFFHSYYGNLAYLVTPSVNSAIYNYNVMNQWINFLLNADFGGSNFEQIGWTVTDVSFCGTCGITAPTKAIVYVDPSVYGNSYPHNTNLGWANGVTILAEHICQSSGYYGQEISYNGNIWGHLTNVPCTTAQNTDQFDNSVFFENQNTVPSSNWNGDLGSVYGQNAYEAQDSSNNWIKWTSSTNDDVNCSGYYASGVITNNIANGGTANWTYLSSIPEQTTC
jgi:hypothetical protein